MATAATTIDASTASRLLSSTSGLPGGKAAMPLVAKQVELIKKEREALDALASGTASEEERLNALLVKRHALQQSMAAARRHNNKELKELTEHYKAESVALRQQIDFVKKTNKMEHDRLDIAKRHETELGRVIKAGRTVDASRLARLGDQEKVLQQQGRAVLARTLAEKKGLKTGEDLATVHKEITAELEKQGSGESGFASKFNEKLQSVKENAGKLGFELEGLTKTQSLMVHGFGKVAEFASFSVAMGFAKKALTGFAEAADSVTEAQYHSGVSFDKLDHSISHYAKTAVGVAELNTNLGLTLTSMGLDADEAKDIVPKMLSKNGVALQEFMRGNTDAVQKMGAQAGAYAKQSGQSVEESLDFQNQLMADQGKSADQAADSMNGIVGSFRGVNDYLQTHGFKGALLNVTALSKVTQEAAAQAKNASFNTETYSKALSKAAGAARMFGMSEKSANEYGQARAGAANSEDKYAQMQRGTRLNTYLNGKYGGLAAKGDVKALSATLVAEQKLSAEDAENVASMMISKARGKGGPMYESRLAEAMEGTEANDKAFQENVKAIFKRGNYDPRDPTAINRLQTDPLFLNLFGKQVLDPESRKLAMGAWHEYQSENGIAGTTVTPPPSGKTAEQAMAEEQLKAKQAANTANTAKNSLFSWQNLKNKVEVIARNPFADIAAGSAAAIAAPAIKGFVSKRVTGVLGKLLPGRAASEAVEGAGAEAVEGIGGKLAAEDAAKAAAKATAKSAEKSVTSTGIKALSKSPALRKIGVSLFKGLMRNKKVALAGTLGLGAAGLGYHLLGNEDAASASQAAAATPTTTPTVPTLPQVNGLNANQATAPTPYTPPATSTSLMDIGINTGINGIINTGEWGIKKLFGKGATSAAEAGAGTVAKKGISKVLGVGVKVGAREIPLLGGLISGLMTGVTTKGPLGRKIMAGVGDAAGTLGGQALTGGLGGALAGTALGGAGAFGMTKLYDSVFGGAPSTAVPAVAKAAQATPGFNITDAMSAVTGAPPVSTGPGPRIAGIGSFSTMRPDGTVVLTVPVTGFPQAVQQATNFNQAMTTQYSGKRT
jgi:hypothetical protein